MLVVDVVSICSAVIAMLGLITSVFALFKKGKKNRVFEILSKVPQYINEAEQLFGPKTGPAKLEWVITKVNIECALANVEVSRDEVVERVREIMQTPQEKEEENLRSE